MAKQAPSAPITIQTLAKRLNLSPGTISSVLNERTKERRISEKTAERVRRMVRELNYVPNDLARSLRLQRTGVIGIIVPDFSMNWVDRVMKGMLTLLDEFEYVPYISLHMWDHGRERREIHSMVQRRVEGIVCAASPNEAEVYEEAERHNIPLVFLGETSQELQRFNIVDWSSGPAVECAIAHLVEQGRRKIAFLWNRHPTTGTAERHETYLRCLREHGIEQRPNWDQSLPMMASEADEQGALDALLNPANPDDRPDALMFLNDAIALHFLPMLIERGVRVPEDLALVGVGDLPGTELPGVGLTTMREPCEQMGSEALRLLLELIQNTVEAPVHRKIECVELRARTSTLG